MTAKPKEKIKKLIRKDLTGQKFGKLTVVNDMLSDSTKCLAICDCKPLEPPREYQRGHLKSGHTGSCGCIRQSKNKYLVGEEFGQLTVVEVLGSSKRLCLCSCGKKEVRTTSYLRKNNKNCVCGECGGRESPLKKYPDFDWFWKTFYSNLDSDSACCKFASALYYYNHHSYSDTDLSFQEFIIETQKPCFWCGVTGGNCINTYARYAKTERPPREFLLQSGDFICNGLDRIDNSKGHEKNNIVPCCHDCNMLRGKMSIIEFINWLIKLNHYKLERNKLLLLGAIKYYGLEEVPKDGPIKKDYPVRPQKRSRRKEMQKTLKSEEIKMEPGLTRGLLKLVRKGPIVKDSAGSNRPTWVFWCNGCGEEVVIWDNRFKTDGPHSCNKMSCKNIVRKNLGRDERIINNEAWKISFERRWRVDYIDFPLGWFYYLLEFKVSPEGTKMPCGYCGAEMLNSYCYCKLSENVTDAYKKNATIKYNGIDRKNNDDPSHSSENIIGICCKICNYARKDMEIQDFLNQISILNTDENIDRLLKLIDII